MFKSAHPKSFKRMRINHWKYGWREYIIVRTSNGEAVKLAESHFSPDPTPALNAQKQEDIEYVTRYYDPMIVKMVMEHWERSRPDIRISASEVERIHDDNVTDYVTLAYLRSEGECKYCHAPFYIIDEYIVHSLDLIEVHVSWECEHAFFLRRFEDER